MPPGAAIEIVHVSNPAFTLQFDELELVSTIEEMPGAGETPFDVVTKTPTDFVFAEMYDAGLRARAAGDAANESTKRTVPVDLIAGPGLGETVGVTPGTLGKARNTFAVPPHPAEITVKPRSAIRASWGIGNSFEAVALSVFLRCGKSKPNSYK